MIAFLEVYLIIIHIHSLPGLTLNFIVMYLVYLPPQSTFTLVVTIVIKLLFYAVNELCHNAEYKNIKQEFWMLE